MAFPSVFEASTTESSLNRLTNLTNETKPQWGKMNSAQVLAHLNVSYDATYGKINMKPNFMMKLMMKMFIKKIIVGDKPYKVNSPTAKEFIISDVRDFEKEKALLIANIIATEKHGKAFFEGKVKFRKPISCHLYPVRITKYKAYDAVNYEKWSVCMV